MSKTICRKYKDHIALINSAVHAFFFGFHAVCAFLFLHRTTPLPHLNKNTMM